MTIYIHPTLAAKPARIAFLERTSGLQAKQGRVFGVLANPNDNSLPALPKKSKSAKSKCWFKEEVRKALNEIIGSPNDFNGGSAA